MINKRIQKLEKELKTGKQEVEITLTGKIIKVNGETEIITIGKPVKLLL